MSIAFTYIAPQVTAGELLPGSVPQDETNLALTSGTIWLYGQFFGIQDYTIIGNVGTADCMVTTWTSDSSLLCKLYDQYEAADVAGRAFELGRVCRNCFDNVQLGCSNTTAGFCITCEPCGPGTFRSGCTLTSAGSCVDCANEDEEVGFRFFKPNFGNASDLCQPCTVCGGATQNGTEYDARRCTAFQDTDCQQCASCPNGQIRVGCGDDSPGFCVEIAPGVTEILAGNSRDVGDFSIRNATGGPIPGEYFFTSPFALSLLGEYSDCGLRVGASTTVRFPDRSNGRLGMSVFTPAANMRSLPARRAAIAEPAVAHLQDGLRRAVSASDLSLPVYFSPTGATFSPPAQASVPLTLEQLEYARLLVQTRTAFELNVYKWNTVTSAWEPFNAPARLEGRAVWFETTSFSTFSAAINTIGTVPNATDTDGDVGIDPEDPVEVVQPTPREPYPGLDPTDSNTSDLLPMVIVGAVIAFLTLLACGYWYYRWRKERETAEALKSANAYPSQREIASQDLPVWLRMQQQADGAAPPAPEPAQTVPQTVPQPAPQPVPQPMYQRVPTEQELMEARREQVALTQHVPALIPPPAPLEPTPQPEPYEPGPPLRPPRSDPYARSMHESRASSAAGRYTDPEYGLDASLVYLARDLQRSGVDVNELSAGAPTQQLRQTSPVTIPPQDLPYFLQGASAADRVTEDAIDSRPGSPYQSSLRLEDLGLSMTDVHSRPQADLVYTQRVDGQDPNLPPGQPGQGYPPIA
eukprot:CAMPEP_0202831606 /NCGR_PEP_ID=MMETSP1389-20130828/16960_1 /ASSEMBLY_ACC=CAM_ASM_000865 /TAXON_ID=302021 /ORGANISM="Rhodomonas sp., Strain CCMP768" /LENGTH=750 /DNA_ID=CAMNT_0049505367 /DNA_START=1 /DNA_END=2253 /DNA_ORIENTATION=+